MKNLKKTTQLLTTFKPQTALPLPSTEWPPFDYFSATRPLWPESSFGVFVVLRRNGRESVMSVSCEAAGCIETMYEIEIERDPIKSFTQILEGKTNPINPDIPSPHGPITWEDGRIMTEEALTTARQIHAAGTGSQTITTNHTNAQIILDQFAAGKFVTFRSEQKIPRQDNHHDREIITGQFDPATGLGDGLWTREYVPYSKTPDEDTGNLTAQSIFCKGILIAGSLRFGNNHTNDYMFEPAKPMGVPSSAPHDCYFPSSLDGNGRKLRLDLDPNLSDKEKQALHTQLGLVRIMALTTQIDDMFSRIAPELVNTKAKKAIKLIDNKWNPFYWYLRLRAPSKGVVSEWIHAGIDLFKNSERLRQYAIKRNIRKATGNIAELVQPEKADDLALSPYARQVHRAITALDYRKLLP